MSSEGIPSIKVGTVVQGKWVILEWLGKGAMGEVYRAHQVDLNRDVAIKVISQDWLRSLEENPQEIETTLKRFRREVQTIAQVRHPNIIQVFDYGSFLMTESGAPATVEYIVMEYVPGATLRDTMSDEGFYPDQNTTKAWLTRYFLPMLDGVQAIHRVGVVHRDLKPGNVLLDGEVPKILDFGLARSNRLRPVTDSIEVKGTLAYMPPEQFFDLKHAAERADIYSLGKILFEAVSGSTQKGTLPFKQAALTHPKGEFFQELDRIIQEATAEDCDERTPSVDAMREALVRLVERGQEKEKKTTLDRALRLSGKSRKWGMILGTVGAGLVVVLLTLWMRALRDESPGTAPGQALAPGVEESVVSERPMPPATESGTGAGQALPAGLAGREGVTLHLVPGGQFDARQAGDPNSEAFVQVDSFYMDETPVTNHQYVEFLNEVLPMLTVEDGVVRSGEDIWILLGKVAGAYEPIGFSGGRFHISGPGHAACAVLRVTAYGAAAYARFQGRRLPTEIEWLYAFEKGRRGGPSSGSEGIKEALHPARSVSEPTVAVPVLLFKPNMFGLRGLNDGLREWVRGPEGERPEYLVAGWLSRDLETEGRSLAAVARQPWEAFEDAGFRCALSKEPGSRGIP